MNNQDCKIRSGVISINSNEPSFYPDNILVNKFGGSCNDINNPCAKLCVPDVFKNMGIKVSNLVSRTNETRHISWHETCKCKCRLDPSVCNNKQYWNNDKCKWECRELIDEGRCHKGFIWHPNNCEGECCKSCDVREYLEYES